MLVVSRRRIQREAEEARAVRDREFAARIAELSKPQGPEGPRPSAVRTVRRLVFRGRRLLGPFAVLAVVFGVGAGTGATAGGAALWLLLIGAWWLARGRSRVTRPVECRYTLAVVVGGLVWLGLAASFGAFEVAPVLGLGWVLLSLPWWAHHWPADRKPEPVIPVESTQELWDRYVADQGGPLPAAVLHHPTVTPHARAYRVQLRRGRQDMSTALSALPKIATGLDVPMHRLLFDPVPADELGGQERPSLLRLQIVTESPIEETVYFDRPRFDGGTVLLGPHGDGDGDARWRVYVDNGMLGGFVLGSLNAGKSSLFDGLVLTIRAMPVKPITVYLDGQSGASSPTLWKHATLRGGPDDVPAILAALHRGLKIRQKWNTIHHLSGFTPGLVPDGAQQAITPVLVIADECHRIFRDHAEPWADFAREGRKCGMAVVGASQAVDLSTFGQNDALRSSLLAGNGVAMRTASRMAGLFPGLGELNPFDFPPLPGYGYKVAAQGSGERTAPFRGRFLPDAGDARKAAERGVPVPVPTVEEWFARTPDGVLDDMTARVFGDVFLRRDELAEEARRRALDEIEGRTSESAAVEPVVETAPATARDKVLAILRDGPATRAELIRQSGMSESSVQKATAGLLAEGLVERAQHGLYGLIS